MVKQLERARPVRWLALPLLYVVGFGPVLCAITLDAYVKQWRGASSGVGQDREDRTGDGMSGSHRAAPGDDARWWATLSPDALEDEIRSNARSERRLLVVVALVAAGGHRRRAPPARRRRVSARVLVVDDEPDELALITRHLRRLGHDVVAAKSAEEALADDDNLDASTSRSSTCGCRAWAAGS